METVNLTDARIRLSELVEHAATGDTICIVRRGKPVAQLTAINSPRKPVDLAALRALTETMPRQEEPERMFVRYMRDKVRC
jgi:prevent-host-death family protein